MSMIYLILDIFVKTYSRKQQIVMNISHFVDRKKLSTRTNSRV